MRDAKPVEKKFRQGSYFELRMRALWGGTAPGVGSIAEFRSAPRRPESVRPSD